ncbi:MAG: FAD-dependent oxidoreductase [Candidatus Gracilibacteria bacterium]|jgi:NAD(P)H-flavin reductase
MQKAKLISKTQIAESIFELKFETEKQFDFIPGQYITFKIDDKKSAVPCFRSYSISSIPNGNTFEVCMKKIENGRGSEWIADLNDGSETDFMGPIGNFTIQEDGTKNILFLAAGTGIGPLKSFIENELKKGTTRNMHLIFGVRHIKDIFYKDFFEELAKKHPNFKFTLTLSQPENDSWKGEKGRVTNILEKMEIDKDTTSGYICGLKEMVTDCTTMLAQKGVPTDRVYSEKYN